MSGFDASKTALRATQVAGHLVGRRAVDSPEPAPAPPTFRSTPRPRPRPLPRPGERDLRADSLALRIRAHLPAGQLDVSFTDNRYTMISVRRDADCGPRYTVRLHHMFADASPAVTRALALYIGDNDAQASRMLGRFIDEHQDRIRYRMMRAQPIVTRGDYHDLQEIYDDLNATYFGGRIDATITWGPRTGKPRRRSSIKMGSYSVEERLIRIHRSLDRPFVPRFFVAWVVYHEMLHQVHGACIVNGRRRFHTRAFLEDEARYDFSPEARAWEREHIDEILRY